MLKWILTSHFHFQGTDYDARYPYMILFAMFLVGIVAMMFLPETLHQKLPETLRDAEKFGKTQQFWYLPKPVHKTTHHNGKEENGNQFVAGDKDSDVLEKLNQPKFST